MSRSRSRLAADWFAKLRLNDETNKVEHTDVKEDITNSSMAAADILTEIKTVGGSGSGLDADTVDGIQGSSFLRSDADNTGSPLRFGTQLLNFSAGAHTTIPPMSIKLWDNYTNAGAPTTYGTVLDIYGKAEHSHHQFYMYGRDLRVRSGFYGNDNWSGWAKIWNSDNDGSGSGLDADTVDGIQGSSIVTKTDNQALHDTDALRISGSTLYLYKGDGGNESVALPSPSSSLKEVLKNTVIADGSQLNTGPSYPVVPTSNNGHKTSGNFYWPFGTSTIRIRLRLLARGESTGYDPYGWLLLNGANKCYVRPSNNTPGANSYSGFTTVTVKNGDYFQLKGSGERTYIQPYLYMEYYTLPGEPATVLFK